jgi:hypothetical protein
MRASSVDPSIAPSTTVRPTTSAGAPAKASRRVHCRRRRGGIAAGAPLIRRSGG